MRLSPLPVRLQRTFRAETDIIRQALSRISFEIRR